MGQNPHRPSRTYASCCNFPPPHITRPGDSRAPAGHHRPSHHSYTVIVLRGGELMSGAADFRKAAALGSSLVGIAECREWMKTWASRANLLRYLPNYCG